MGDDGGRAVSNSLVAKVHILLRACMARDSSERQMCMIFHGSRWELDPRWLKEPRIVRIGLFSRQMYNRVARLETMQNHKWLCTARLLYAQSGLLGPGRSPVVLIRHCLETIDGLEQRIKGSYFQEFFLDKDELLLTVMLDGCFILFLLLIHDTPREQFGFDFLNKELGENHIRNMVKHDLLLLGNQLPFFVVRALCSVVMPGRAHEALIRGGLQMFSTIWQLAPSATITVSCDQVHHLLHLFYLSVIPDTHLHNQESRGLEQFPWRHSMSKPLRATELEKAGIKIRATDDERSFLSIGFRDGVLEIPPLQIDGNAGVVLGSLIALEQAHGYTPYPVTSYVYFMKHLIRGPDDCKLLKQRGIIRTNAFPAFSSLISEQHHIPYSFELTEESITPRKYYGCRWLRNFRNPVLRHLMVLVAIFLLLCYPYILSRSMFWW